MKLGFGMASEEFMEGESTHQNNEYHKHMGKRLLYSLRIQASLSHTKIINLAGRPKDAKKCGWLFDIGQ